MKATMRVSDNTYNGANLRASHRSGGRANNRAYHHACLCAYHCADPQATGKVRA